MYSQDQRIPLIGFFANRKIKPGEELTWDYNLVTDDMLVVEKYRCKCGNSDCRKSFYRYENPQSQ